MEPKVITAIKPLIEEPENLEWQIYYPYYIASLRCEVWRAMGDPLTFNVTISVDMVRAQPLISDVYPDFIDVTVRGDIIPQRIGERDAIELAKKRAVRIAMTKYRALKPPRLTIEAGRKAYKIFYIVAGERGRVIVDSITGFREKA